MRETIDMIDAGGFDENLQGSMYRLTAEQLAAQALALAAFKQGHVNPQTASRWIEAAAGYPGVTMRKIPGSENTIGSYATQRLLSLAHARVYD